MSKNQPPSDKKQTGPTKNATPQGQKQNPISDISKKGKTLGAQHASHGDGASKGGRK